jgi:hypothetical protein
MTLIKALDVIGQQLVQLLHQTNTVGFLLLPLKVVSVKTAIFLLRLERLLPQKKGEKQILIGSKMRERYRRSESGNYSRVNTSHLSKERGLIGIKAGLLKNFEGLSKILEIKKYLQ